MSDVKIQAESRRSFTGRIIDFCCLSFAAWTVLCNAVVLVEGSLLDLLRLTGLTVLAVVTAWLLWRRRTRAYGPSGRLDGGEGLRAQSSTVAERGLGVRATALAVGVMVILSYPLTGSFTLFWWLFTAYFAVAAFIALRQPIVSGKAGGEQPLAVGPRGRRNHFDHWRLELVLLGIGVLCAAITLFAHRPDNDEVFYVNLAIDAADHPAMPLLKYENIHGIPDRRINAFYRVISIEVLTGAISYLSGIPALAASHWLVATLAGFLVPLAYGKLFRNIGGQGWIWGVAGAMVFLLVDGTAHANYGNLAFVRLYQGKCIFLSVAAPCIIAFALGFTRRPTVKGWLLLSAALIAGTGLTATAVWVGPALAALALVVASRSTRRGLAVLVAGASATFYPLMVGLVLKLGAGISTGSSVSSVSKVEPFGLAEQGFLKVLDDNLAPLLVVMLAWLLVKRTLPCRFATVFPLGFALILNPYTAPWVAHNLTGVGTFWRVFWLLPLPALVGLTVIGCRQLVSKAERQRATRLVGYVGVFALVATLFPPRYTLSRANGVEIKLPALKMPAVYDYVEMVNRGVAAGAYVLAPPEISQWMVTQNRHAYPLLSIPKYLRRRLEPAELERRARLMSYVSGRQRAGIHPEALRRSLKDYQLTGVCLDVRAPWRDEIRTILAEERFRKAATQEPYEMWTLKHSVD